MLFSRLPWSLVSCCVCRDSITGITTPIFNNTQNTQVRIFVSECAAGGASDTLRFVFVLMASNLEHDLLGLHAVLKANKGSGPRAARPAQSPGLSVVRQRVHALLGSST